MEERSQPRAGKTSIAAVIALAAFALVSCAAPGRDPREDAPLPLLRSGVAAGALLLLARGLDALGASARAFDRTLRVARTLADLAGVDRVEDEQVAEALALRLPDLPGAP